MDQADKLVLTYGNQLCIFRRLRLADVLFGIVHCLDRARKCSAERKDILVIALMYDLHLMIMKIGLNNFTACLFSMLTKRYEQQFSVGPAFEGIYKKMFDSLAVDPKFEDAYKIENIISVRQLCAELLKEIDETTQQMYLINVTSSSNKLVDHCNKVERFWY